MPRPRYIEDTVALAVSGFLADAFGRSLGEEPIRNAVLNLVGVGDGIEVIEANDLIEIVDAGDPAVDHVRLDDVLEHD